MSALLAIMGSATPAEDWSLRILFAADVSPDPDSGAAGTEWQTIQALRRLGHDVDEIWAADLGRRIQHGNLHYLIELPRAYRRVIGDRCRQARYDVIHANQGHCYLAAREHRRAQRAGVFICRSHGLDDHMEHVLAPWRDRFNLSSGNGLRKALGNVLNGLLQRHDRAAYRETDGIIVSSGVDERYLREVMQVAPDRIGRIAQAPAAAFVATPAIALDAQRLRRILHVGGFAYWKGVHAVAEAANRLFASSTCASLTWVCRSEEHGQVRSLLTPAAQARVELAAWCSQEQLCAVYDRHGIFLCPSLFEGFGKVFVEAMARGLCVVGTPTGGMPDLIDDGRSGFLVGFHDPDGIVARVQQLWANPASAQAISSLAARTARNYSWERVGRETAEFYRRRLAARAEGSRE